jgi:hypothetical protein
MLVRAVVVSFMLAMIGITSAAVATTLVTGRARPPP